MWSIHSFDIIHSLVLKTFDILLFTQTTMKNDNQSNQTLLEAGEMAGEKISLEGIYETIRTNGRSDLTLNTQHQHNQTKTNLT